MSYRSSNEEEFSALARELYGLEDHRIALRVARDARFTRAARAQRAPLLAKVEKELGPFEPLYLQALLEVPRERFVRGRDVVRSAEDTPLPLDELGLATISAPHAYLLSFRLLPLQPGDSLIELGSGSGYGAALAAFIVGPSGNVRTFEIDDELALQTEKNLTGYANVEVRLGDAIESPLSWGDANKVVCTFAVQAIPPVWLSHLRVGSTLVAPVGPMGKDQRLVRVERTPEKLVVTDHGGVRYVSNRSTH